MSYTKLGDCKVLLNDVKDNSIDIVVTDPPYDLDIRHDGGKLYQTKGFTQSNIELIDVNIDLGFDVDWFCTEMIRVMKGINIYIWCNKKQIPFYIDFFVSKHNAKFDILCWHKTNALPTYNHKYLTDTEYLLYFQSGGKNNPQTYEDAKTYYFAPINQFDKNEYHHPTIKPLDITKKIIRNSSTVGDVVLDPFMGSGTTCVAAKELGREYIGFEIDEKYFTYANRRIEGISVLEEKDKNKESLW